MTQRLINTGQADKGNGDPIRTAFSKVNDNFAELYTQLAASVVVGATAPTAPEEGSLWWNSTSGRMYVYYGTAWVDASPVDGAGISSTNELVNGAYSVVLESTGALQANVQSIVSDNQLGIEGNGLLQMQTLDGPYISIFNEQGTQEINLVAYNGIDASPTWTFGTDGATTFPDSTVQSTAWTGITGFGEGFGLTATDKIVTNKLYSTNLTQPTQHYRLELDTNGVVRLPDGSIINGSTIRGVAGTSELNYTGITIGPNSNDAEKTWMWVDHANAYISTNNAANTWTFGNNGSLTFPDTTAQTTAWTGSVSSLVNSTKTVSLGTDGTLSLPAGPTLLTNVNQIVSATINRTGASTDTQAIAAAQDTWIGLEQTFADIRDQDAQLIEGGGYTRPWAGLPSWEAYPLITTYVPGETQLPAPNVIAPAANNAINAYLAYKELVSNIDIVSGDTAFSFENTGSLRVPGVITKDNSLILVSSGMSGVLPNGNSASVTADGQYGRVFIRTNNSETLRTWQFDINGALTFPDASVIASYKPVTVIAATTTAQTITDNASAAFIQFVETVDTAGAFSPGTFTAPYTGYYQINMSVYFSTTVSLTSTSFLLIDTNLDFTKQVRIIDGGWTGSYLHYSTVISATAGDAIRVAFRQVSGGDVEISSGSRLTIHRVSIS